VLLGVSPEHSVIGAEVQIEMEKHFCVCRVLATKPYRLDYVVFQESELTRRHDVEVVSKGFATEAAAKAAIIQLGGAIPEGHAMFLDFWEENFETVWNWKDERTMGASQTFKSEQEALDAWNDGKLIFDALVD
jgi:hypothetical protein